MQHYFTSTSTCIYSTLLLIMQMKMLGQLLGLDSGQARSEVIVADCNCDSTRRVTRYG